MKFTAKENEEIIARFVEVAPKAECPLCHNSAFNMGLGIISLQLQEIYPPEAVILGGFGKHYPCVGLTCNTCGNVFLINIKTLGLDHLLEKVTRAEEVGEDGES